jgi:hypothetical protein
VFPDLGVGVRLLFRELFQVAEHAARDSFLIAARTGHLARDTERKIGGIDDAQVAQEDLGLVGDEHALHVELYAPLAVGIEQVERPRAGNQGERGVFVAPLGAEMDGERRLVELPGEAAVEIGVVGGGDVALRLGPERDAVGHLHGLGARVLDDRDRHRHMPRLLADDPLQATPRPMTSATPAPAYGFFCWNASRRSWCSGKKRRRECPTPRTRFWPKPCLARSREHSCF